MGIVPYTTWQRAGIQASGVAISTGQRNSCVKTKQVLQSLRSVSVFRRAVVPLY
jgi:hypothetical protein